MKQRLIIVGVMCLSLVAVAMNMDRATTRLATLVVYNNYAIQVSGTNFLQSASTSELSNLPAFTIEFTFTTTNPGSSLQPTIISQSSDTPCCSTVSDRGWRIELLTDGTLLASFVTTYGSHNVLFTNSLSFLDGNPHRVLYVRDYNNATGSALFVDGIRASYSSAGNRVRVFNEPYWVGKGIWQNSTINYDPTTNFFEGVIDEIRISTNAVVAPSATSYTTNACLTNIVGSTLHLWHLDEGTGTNAPDSVGGLTLSFDGSTPTPIWTSGFCLP
jgi:hypothetical protein